MGNHPSLVLTWHEALRREHASSTSYLSRLPRNVIMDYLAVYLVNVQPYYVQRPPFRPNTDEIVGPNGAPLVILPALSGIPIQPENITYPYNADEMGFIEDNIVKEDIPWLTTAGRPCNVYRMIPHKNRVYNVRQTRAGIVHDRVTRGPVDERLIVKKMIVYGVYIYLHYTDSTGGINGQSLFSSRRDFIARVYPAQGVFNIVHQKRAPGLFIMLGMYHDVGGHGLVTGVYDGKLRYVDRHDGLVSSYKVPFITPESKIYRDHYVAVLKRTEPVAPATRATVTVTIIYLQDGCAIREISRAEDGPRAVTCIAFDDDGHLYLTYGDGTMAVWYPMSLGYPVNPYDQARVALLTRHSA